MINVLIIEDHLEFAESLQQLLSDTEMIRVVGVYRNAKDIVRQINAYKPDIVLMDIDMPVCNGLDGLRSIRAANLDMKVIMLTVFDDNERVFQAVCNGASGYLLKSSTPDAIIEGIIGVYNGGATMTPSIARQVLKIFSAPYQHSTDMQNLTSREHDVLSLLVRGYSYKMIAAEMNLGIETVRFHIKNIYTKLHVNSKSEAVAKALQNRIGK
ncbi:MAG: response regulator transcription factor [Chitinophagaceae bacterium]|nr:response regulator transcription factor [Chitinophagaceae bacterium]